jgi:hypothetical protein
VYHDCCTEGRQRIIWLHVLASLQAVIRSNRKYILRERGTKSVCVSKSSSWRSRLLKLCACACVCVRPYIVQQFIQEKKDQPMSDEYSLKTAFS